MQFMKLPILLFFSIFLFISDHTVLKKQIYKEISVVDNLTTMQQREEKQLETALDAIILRVNDIKASIAQLIYKVENEYDTMNWPTFLDNYALLSGHLTSLSKILGQDKCPALRNLTVLPLMLSPERDESLTQMTEGRVTACAHDLVPDYLRTKLEPLAEQRMLQLEHKASVLAFDNAQKQATAYQKVVTHVWEIVSKAREEWEVEASARANSQQNSSMADTHLLVAAVGMGKGLKMVAAGPGQPGSGMIVGGPGGVRPVGPGPSGAMPSATPTMAMNKVPSGIKTNIKSATQIHPYGR